MLDDYFSMFKIPKKHEYTFERGTVTFKVIIDYELLFNQVDSLRENYEHPGVYDDQEYDEEYTEYVTVGTEDKVSVAEYKAEIDQILKDLVELRDTPAIIEKLCDGMPKKKNGTFAKGRVSLIKEYRKTAYYVEDCYGWKYKAIRIKSISDTDAEVYINTEIEHY